MERHMIGRFGEWWVRMWLRARGFRILHRNWRGAGTELDIVALRKQVLHIVEVKTTKRQTAVHLNERVSLRQRIKMIQGARVLCARVPNDRREVRFSVAEVHLCAWPRVRWTDDAFRADDVGNGRR